MILKRSRIRVSWMVGLSVTLATLIAMVLSAPAWAQAKLVVDKRGPDTVQKGQVIAYQIDVKNTGNSPANNVKLTDTVPDGTEFVSLSPVGNCKEDAGTVTCEDLGTVTIDRSAVPVTVQVRADGTQDTIKNTATATSGNLRASDSVTTTLGAGNGGDGNGGSGSDQYGRDVEITNTINIPSKGLPKTGGPPLLGILFSVLAGAGLLTAVLRRRS
ncbi:hypothetical protein BH24ACT22_BH24ACT22_11700 [soil metagenome]